MTSDSGSNSQDTDYARHINTFANYEKLKEGRET
jgi:hypothetical protein